MSDLFGNHIVGFPMRRLIYRYQADDLSPEHLKPVRMCLNTPSIARVCPDAVEVVSMPKGRTKIHVPLNICIFQLCTSHLYSGPLGGQRIARLLMFQYLSRLVGKPTMWFPTRSNINRPVQLQKKARSLKFWS